jgi:hypothetical protein
VEMITGGEKEEEVDVEKEALHVGKAQKKI